MGEDSMCRASIPKEIMTLTNPVSRPKRKPTLVGVTISLLVVSIRERFK
jgi:hypothetical protein